MSTNSLGTQAIFTGGLLIAITPVPPIVSEDGTEGTAGAKPVELPKSSGSEKSATRSVRSAPVASDRALDRPWSSGVVDQVPVAADAAGQVTNSGIRKSDG